MNFSLISTTDLITLILAASIPLGMVLILVPRMFSRRGIGVRAIQFMAISAIIPGTLLLALQGLLKGETIAALFGATVGYLLSSIAKFDERDNSKGQSAPEGPP